MLNMVGMKKIGKAWRIPTRNLSRSSAMKWNAKKFIECPWLPSLFIKKKKIDYYIT